MVNCNVSLSHLGECKLDDWPGQPPQCFAINEPAHSKDQHYQRAEVSAGSNEDSHYLSLE